MDVFSYFRYFTCTDCKFFNVDFCTDLQFWKRSLKFPKRQSLETLKNRFKVCDIGIETELRTSKVKGRHDTRLCVPK